MERLSSRTVLDFTADSISGDSQGNVYLRVGWNREVSHMIKNGSVSWSMMLANRERRESIYQLAAAIMDGI